MNPFTDFVFSGIGNETSCAEFNYYMDPEAAHIVHNSLVCPVIVLPWECCLSTSIPKVKISFQSNERWLMWFFTFFFYRNGGTKHLPTLTVKTFNYWTKSMKLRTAIAIRFCHAMHFWRQFLCSPRNAYKQKANIMPQSNCKGFTLAAKWCWIISEGTSTMSS